MENDKVEVTLLSELLNDSSSSYTSCRIDQHIKTLNKVLKKRSVKYDDENTTHCSSKQSSRCNYSHISRDAFCCLQRLVAHILLKNKRPEPLKDISLAQDDKLIDEGTSKLFSNKIYDFHIA